MVLKPTKLFHQRFEEVPRSGDRVVIIEGFDSLRPPSYEGEELRGGGKRILCDGSFAEFLRSRSTLYVQPSLDAEGMHGEFYSSAGGEGEGSLPALPPRHEARKFELIKRLPYDSNSPRKYDGDSWMRHQLLKFFHRVEREWNYFCSLRFNGKCLENIDENKKSIRKFIKLIKLAHKNKN